MQHVHDAVAYPGFAYPDTHPDRMAVMATLHGLQPTPVAHCRVLEVGCNEGANLIPMAYAIPGSEFVGFDIAQLPIARAQEKIHALALSNVRVFQADITEIDQRLGKFDYIIAHGIYAWIAEPVRESLLALCRDHLTPNGIAFISYNALPGGHLRNMMREILSDRVASASDPMQGVSAGMGFLKNIIDLRPEGDPLSALLDKEAKQLEKRNPRDIYHDEMSPDQRPVLFSTFAAHAARNDLRYVSESAVMTLNDPSNQPRAAALAKEMAGGDRIVEEQILDFIRMRGYRETLLCHAKANSSAEIRMDALRQMHLASQAQSTPGDDPESKVFSLPGGVAIETADAKTIFVLEYLAGKWPHGVPFAQLEQFLGTAAIEVDEEVLTLLLGLVSARMVQLHVWEAPVSVGIADRPCASAPGRHEVAAHGMMTTLHHCPMLLGDDLARQFLSLLDGSRDRGELSKALLEKHPEIAEASIMDGIETSLHMLHRAGALVIDDFRCSPSNIVGSAD